MVARVRRHLLRVVGLAVLSCGLAACDLSVDGSGGLSLGMFSARAQDEWNRTYPFRPGGRLEIINVNGRITAEPNDGSSVEIRAERVARVATEEAARELLSAIEMREEVGDERVRIEVRAPQRNGGGHEIRWTVRVPKGVNVDFRTVNGGVRMSGLDGEVRARSTNGGVSGQALHATAVDAAVTNGGVEIELANAPTSGTFELEAVNGGVSLALPADSRADVTLRCVNGAVAVSGLDVEADGEQSRRLVQGRLNGGGARVTMSTTNGGVRLSRSAG
jgi:DUF4097 and DUF4098 domain-containing protein YvlB